MQLNIFKFLVDYWDTGYEWVVFGNKIYKVGTDLRAFSSAQSECQAERQDSSFFAPQ